MGRLTDRSVRTVGEGRHGDGDGLQLIVSASGRRKWVLRYQLNGVRRDMGLGSYPAIGLSDARIAAADARKLIARGIDPLDDRKASREAERPVPTFQPSGTLRRPLSPMLRANRTTPRSVINGNVTLARHTPALCSRDPCMRSLPWRSPLCSGRFGGQSPRSPGSCTQRSDASSSTPASCSVTSTAS